MRGQRSGAVAEPPKKPACIDPESEQYRQHLWVQWGDDPRYKRCRHCGEISAEDISNEAKYPREKQPERPRKHHHSFEPSLLVPGYERCFCGASR